MSFPDKVLMAFCKMRGQSPHFILEKMLIFNWVYLILCFLFSWPAMWDGWHNKIGQQFAGKRCVTRRAISAPLLTCVLGLPDSLQNRGSFQRLGDTPWMWGGGRLLCRTPAILFYFISFSKLIYSIALFQFGLNFCHKLRLA